ncbi:enolase C-terminal domain-like protein [Nocardia abscessus]|uniref:enolase C-terminal domain-like protein n=1 Tax=Nocardia abscessus TaxID=120957 RepID=UPI003CC7F1F1
MSPPGGGLRRALQVAEAAGLPCVVSSALETSVGLAAQLALAGALPELDFACGLGTLSLLTGDVTPGSLRPSDGYLPVLRTPPAPDPDLLERHRHPDAERTAWWQERLARVTALL